MTVQTASASVRRMLQMSSSESLVVRDRTGSSENTFFTQAFD